MQIKKGIPVSPGIAIADALVIDAHDKPVLRRTVLPNRVAAEVDRLKKAIAQSINEIGDLRKQTAAALGEKMADIFSVHARLLADKSLVDQLIQAVQTERVTAEYAVYSTLQAQAQSLLQSDNEYLRERARDFRDVERRVLSHLTGGQDVGLATLDRPAIIFAHDLTPSQTAALDKSRIVALATDAGGRTSHTAILAHALGIPAIVGLEDITSRVNTGDTVIIDGNRGQVVIEPDAAVLMDFRQQQRRQASFVQTLGELRDLPAVTKDGHKIALYANIEFPSEIMAAVENGATAVGLYRTEFQFLASDHEPSEEEQYEQFVEAIRRLKGKPLTIRTLDLGADKISDSLETVKPHAEPNPFLGCRSIRLCLQNLNLFKTQLRAILRASAEGPVRIMFPLISHVMELRQARMILADVREDLDDAGLAYDNKIPVGMMVEVPSAALQAKTFAREVDFFSIGTNDLIQYTVAVDRSNERIASLYSAAHPAVLTLIREVIKAAKRTDIEVSLCGEMASQPEYTILLLGLGLRSFSITPPAIPEIKKIIRSVKLSDCVKVAKKVSTFDSDREVLNYLRDQVSKVIPEVFDGRSIGN